MTNDLQSALSILKAVWSRNYSVVSEDNRWLSKYLAENFGFSGHNYKSLSELNHWKIPLEVAAEKATISDSKNNLLFDAIDVPLALPPLCPSINARVSREELQEKLVTVPEIPEARFYAWWNLYRTEADWSFSLTHEERDRILSADRAFQVLIETREQASEMLVDTLLHAGRSKDTIVVTAHTCHPFQANDDMSGVAAALWLARQLSSRETKFSYLFLLAPELFGPMFWLDELTEESRTRLVGCIQLKSVANDHDMRLQRSFSGDSFLDFFAEKVLPVKNSHTVRNYRECYGNDETVFEACPYNIPAITYTRMPTDKDIPPFFGYHTSVDNIENLDEARLEESCDLLLSLVDEIEKGRFPKLLVKGVPRLGDLGLYCPLPSGSLESGVDYNSLEMRKHVFMNCVSNLANGKVSTEQMAERYNLPQHYVDDYLDKWANAGLLAFI